MIYIVMGVSGCGKSTVGKLLADTLKCPFYDADDFHPETNLIKMTNGVALTDDDRKPWLELLAEQIQYWTKNGSAVLACSALKQCYRDTLISNNKNSVVFIYLSGQQELLEKRIRERKNHFMPVGLLSSQFNDLEPPIDAIEISFDNPVIKIVSDVLDKTSNIDK